MNIIVGNDLVKSAGITSDKVTKLYGIDTYDFKGNIATLKNSVKNSGEIIIDSNYIYIKSIEAGKMILLLM